jgi:prephenate dehydrogenase
MKIIGVGLGLIGGSMLLSLKKHYSQSKFLGIDKNKNHIAKAIDLSIISAEANENDIKTADLIIVSIPVDAAQQVVSHYLDAIGEQTLIIDTGSTKEELCKAVELHPKRHQFLAAHPIAGTEFSGPSAALDHLFEDKTMIICEIEKTDPKLQNMALDCFAKLKMKLRFMNPKAHNKHMAYVSHLSHISSFMLGKTVIDKEEDERNIFDLAGSGFESTVRLAKSNPKTWVPIFKQNKTFVLEALTEYISNLEQFKNELLQDEYDRLEEKIKNTNRVKDILKGIHH